MKLKITYLIFVILFISCSNKNETKKSTERDRNNLEIAKPSASKDHEAEKYKELDAKANWFKHGIEKQSTLENLPQSFLDFCNNFITDSIFQKKHIYFDKFIGESGDCEETLFYNEKNWLFLNWDFITFFTVGDENEPIENWNNTVYINDDRIFFEFEIKEVGVVCQIGFENIKNKWELTLYYESSC